MKSLEILQEPDASQEPMVLVQFGDIDPENLHIQYQQPRHRSIIMTPGPEFKPLGVQFWRNESESHGQKADLRDLVLGEAGVAEEDIAGMIESIGIETVRTMPKSLEESESLVTKEEKSQDEFIAFSGHALRAEGLLPDFGAIH